MTHTWGSGTWGSGVWGGHVEYVPILQDNWPLSRATPSDGDVLFDIFTALDTQLGYIDIQADEVIRDHDISEATGEDLDELAAEVGIVRENTESDERLRLRVLIRKAGTRSEGTAEDIAAVLEQIFGDDVTQIGLTSPVDEPVIGLKIPSSLIDNIPLTESTLESQLEQLIPASDAIQIISDDAWLLGEGGDEGVGEGELV